MCTRVRVGSGDTFPQTVRAQPGSSPRPRGRPSIRGGPRQQTGSRGLAPALGCRPPEMGKRDFERLRHVAFFDAMATELPDEYASQEVNHLTLAYFAVGGLSLLRELDRVRSRPFGRSAVTRLLSIDQLEEFCRRVVMFWIHPSAKIGSLLLVRGSVRLFSLQFV